MHRFNRKPSLTSRIADSAGIIGVCLYFLFWILAIYGYFANIFKLIGAAMGGGELGLMLILRIIGIFAAPLGAILGFF